MSKPLTVDAHIDLPWQWQKQGVYDLRQDQSQHGMVDFPRMAQGGLQAAVFALYLSDGLQDRLGKDEARKALWNQILAIQKQPGCQVARSTADAYLIHAAGKVPIFLGVEGGRLLQEDFTLLQALAGAGIRYLTLTHNYNTRWADSATDIPGCGGLTLLGKRIVRACEYQEILVDISHASDATAWAVLAYADKPVIASHSGCRALLDHPRNLSDMLMKTIAVAGGVVHIPFARRFIGQYHHSVADHIDNAVQLAGPQHVGIGSDLDGAAMCEGIDSVADWRKVVNERLAWRGYSDTDIAAIAGGNTLRLLA